MAVTIDGNSGGTALTDQSALRTQKGVPAFKAYQSTASVSITSSVFTKVTLNAEEFDTTGAFDSTSNYRFQPTVAGYYQLNGAASLAATSGLSRTVAALYKNGTSAAWGADNAPSSATVGAANVSSVLYLNGSTDYVELWVYAVGTSLSVNGNNVYVTYMSGALIAAA